MNHFIMFELLIACMCVCVADAVMPPYDKMFWAVAILLGVHSGFLIYWWEPI